MKGTGLVQLCLRHPAADEAFAMVIEDANGADAEDIGDVDGLFPALWVHLAILAMMDIGVPEGAVSAVH
jgi:hypothetical protein